MLQDLQSFYGKKLSASDGEIGDVKDFYFNDRSWAIRYAVVDTGSWLLGRKVLVPRRALVASDDGHDTTLQVDLTRKQIEGSPSLDWYQLVSRRHEDQFHRHDDEAISGGQPEVSENSSSPFITTSVTPASLPPRPNKRDDRHLRSTKAVSGYHVHATVGKIGSVKSFLVDGDTWTIRELIVESSTGFSGRSILLRTRNIIRISDEESTVFVNVTSDDFRDAPSHQTMADDAAPLEIATLTHP